MGTVVCVLIVMSLFQQGSDFLWTESIARFYGNLIGVKYGEPYVVKETLRVDDITTMGVRTF